MTEFEISILNLKVVHKEQLEKLKKQVKNLEEQIRILEESYERIYDL